MKSSEKKKSIEINGQNIPIISWLIRTIEQIEFRLDDVALFYDMNRYVFFDEHKEMIAFFTERNVTSIRRTGLDPTAKEREAVIAAYNLSPEDRDRIYAQAEIETLRFITRGLGNGNIQIFDTLNRMAAPLQLSLKAPEWPLEKTTPEEYLKRYPDGPRADLARTVLAAPAVTLNTLLEFANQEHKRRITDRDGEGPEIRMEVRDIDPEPYMTMPLQAFNELVARGDFQPILPPVYQRAGAIFRPELKNGQIRLWRSSVDYSGKVDIGQSNVPIKHQIHA